MSLQLDISNFIHHYPFPSRSPWTASLTITAKTEHSILTTRHFSYPNLNICTTQQHTLLFCSTVQQTIMAIRPITRSPLLLLTLSICIALPSLAISTHILSIFREEHASNPWWLPIWHAHFNTHGLVATIATSCIIFAVDAISVGLVVAGNRTGSKVRVDS